jgi:hypothetical protein
MSEMIKRLSVLAIFAVMAMVALGSSTAEASRNSCAGVTQTNSYGETCSQFLAAQNAPGQQTSVGTYSTETPSQAYASASTSQYVEYPSSLSLAQATGEQPIPASKQLALASAAGVSVVASSDVNCGVFDSRSWTWGTWPAQQTVTDHTHRCYNGSIVTYRATTVTQGVTLCNADGTQTWRSAGGTGTGFVRWDDQGNFDCPFPLTNGIFLDPQHQRTIILEATGGGGYWIWSAS